MKMRERWKDRCWSVAACLTALILPLIGAFPDFSTELYEGNPCPMEDGSVGVCIELPKCPYRIREVKEGKRFSTSAGRCSFNNFVEIVCCPKEAETTTPGNNIGGRGDSGNDVIGKLGLRAADVACHEYENEIIGENGEKVNPNIFNGEAAAIGEFPYMVALGYKSDKDKPTLVRYICGGTLISLQHVLTAAHCVSNINNLVPVEVKLGIVDLNSSADYVQRIPIAEIATHPKYKRSLNYHDIAIIKLMKGVTITTKVMPICLQTKPIPNMQTLVNMSLIVTGWGSTSFENEGSASLQKTSSLSIIDLTDCGERYKSFGRLPNGLDESMICMLDKNVTRRSDACQGDSGGPLLLLSKVSSTVLGVTSFGQSCGSSIPAIYTSVYFYLDWIEKMVWPGKKQNT